MGPQSFGVLVDSESRRIGSNLKENAARFTEVDGVKIFPVHDRRNVEVELGKLFQPDPLLLIVRRTPRDVMNGSDGDTAGFLLRSTNDIHSATRLSRAHTIAEPGPLKPTGSKPNTS